MCVCVCKQFIGEVNEHTAFLWYCIHHRRTLNFSISHGTSTHILTVINHTIYILRSFAFPSWLYQSNRNTHAFEKQKLNNREKKKTSIESNQLQMTLIRRSITFYHFKSSLQSHICVLYEISCKKFHRNSMNFVQLIELWSCQKSKPTKK